MGQRTGGEDRVQKARQACSVTPAHPPAALGPGPALVRLGAVLTAAVSLAAVAVAAGPAAAAPGETAAAQPVTTTAARSVTATVRTPGIPLNVRSGPAVRHRLERRLPNGSRVGVACRTQGQPIRGTVATTATWARLTRGGYASGAYLRGVSSAPVCRAGAPAKTETALVRTPGIPLNVRSGPATGYQLERRLGNGSRVGVACRTRGQTIRGNSSWARLAGGGYASAAYLRLPRGLDTCRFRSTAPGPAEFLRRAAVGARDSDRRYGIPASVTIAQAMLESGWGTSGLATGGNNYFGIKCIGGTGPIAVDCHRYRTFECVRKKGCHTTYAWFRTYDSVADSFRDHARLLSRASHYQRAMRYKGSPDRFAREVHRGGYATDPLYSRKLITLMRLHNLYRFD